MNEQLLYYVWQYRLYNTEALATTDGEAIVIEQVGVRNHDSGPDFSQARIKIGDNLWAGNVEIHVNASDWRKHKHHLDNNYSNIILHVVYRNDSEIADIPTLVLEGRISKLVTDRYQQLMTNRAWIPCETQLGKVDDFTFKMYLDRLIIERLEAKTIEIIRRLDMNHNNWEETMYQMVARSFGLKVNMDNFDLLATTLPLSIIGKHKNSLFQIEALLFGQAGLLDDDFKEDYPTSLKKEFSFLKRKYDLYPMEGRLWKFMRMRPASFPSVRLAQFAMLLHKSKHLFSQILNNTDANGIKGLFMVSTSSYWHDHYQFDHVSTKRQKRMGNNAIELLIINTIVPLLFVYAQRQAQPAIKDKALTFLEQLPPEQNNITNEWGRLNKAAKSAMESQALIQLKNAHCNAKDCLNCPIGHKILSTA